MKSSEDWVWSRKRCGVARFHAVLPPCSFVSRNADLCLEKVCWASQTFQQHHSPHHPNRHQVKPVVFSLPPRSHSSLKLKCASHSLVESETRICWGSGLGCIHPAMMAVQRQMPVMPCASDAHHCFSVGEGGTFAGSLGEVFGVLLFF